MTAEGSLWKEQRRFTMETLRTFTSSSTERLLQSELQHLLARLNPATLDNKEVGGSADAGVKVEVRNGPIQPLDPRLAVSRAVANVVTLIVFGERLGEDPAFYELNRLICNEIISVSFINSIAYVLGRCAFPLRLFKHIKNSRES